jgi:DNA repair exonuclease SbcCD nuclease subunit
LQPLTDRGIRVVFIAGNHDVYYRETNAINCYQELKIEEIDGFEVFTGPTEYKLDGKKILLVPWINNENREETNELIARTKAKVCFGHLNLKDFDAQRGHKMEEGDDPTRFEKFDCVLTGHYHHKSSVGPIHYLGSIIQSDWSDYDDPRGFHIFDTDSYELTYIQNPFVIFKKVFYNDKDTETLEDVCEQDLTELKDSYVKVVVLEKMNPYWFDLFMADVEKAGPVDIQIVEDHHDLGTVNEEEIISEAEDTLTICHKYIDQIANASVNKTELKTFFSSLYKEAMEITQ